MELTCAVATWGEIFTATFVVCLVGWMVATIIEARNGNDD